MVPLVFELLKILIFIEDTGLFQMYNIHYETTLVLLENQYKYDLLDIVGWELGARP